MKKVEEKDALSSFRFRFMRALDLLLLQFLVYSRQTRSECGQDNMKQ